MTIATRQQYIPVLKSFIKPMNRCRKMLEAIIINYHVWQIILGNILHAINFWQLVIFTVISNPFSLNLESVVGTIKKSGNKLILITKFKGIFVICPFYCYYIYVTRGNLSFIKEFVVFHESCGFLKRICHFPWILWFLEDVSFSKTLSLVGDTYVFLLFSTKCHVVFSTVDVFK